MNINLIYAKSKNGVIGKDNKLPWHLPEDMVRFKQLTEGHVVIMGRKTWESIPEKYRPLPNRINIVITTSKDFSAFKGAEVCNSISQALILASQNDGKEIWVIGGSSIYDQMLPLAERLEVTIIDKDFEGDAYAPVIRGNWNVSSLPQQISKTGLSFSFMTYVKDNSLT